MFNLEEYLIEVSLSPNKDFDIHKYIAAYPNIFPQLNLWGGINEATLLNMSKQNRVRVSWLPEHKITRRIEPYKHVTVWYIATLFFDNTPIGILRNIEYRDNYSDFLPINKSEHHKAARYLFDFLEPDFGPNTEPYDNIGAFSGDLQPHFRSVNTKYYDLSFPADISHIAVILELTLKNNY